MQAAGAVCIVSGASGFGFWMAGEYRRRLEQLLQLRQMIYMLKGQILYANAPLSEALEAVGKRFENLPGQPEKLNSREERPSARSGRRR